MINHLIFKNFEIERGSPLPLGSTVLTNGINFAVHSKVAIALTLCLFDKLTYEMVLEFPLDATSHKTGHVWHIKINQLQDNLLYAYKVFDGIKMHFPLLDPYAKAVSTTNEWGKCSGNYSPLGVIVSHSLNKNDDRPLNIPLHDLIVYEIHTRGFTKHESSGANFKGTFQAIIEKIPYLLDLGINAVEFLPVQEFNELEYLKENPLTKERLYNYWGYSSVNFFSLMNRYGTSDVPGSILEEFKALVKELHKNRIEVLLDIVFNHTAEGNENGPEFSYKGFDKEAYYLFNFDRSYSNFSGCGNTLNCNHPISQELIRDTLRYFVTEMHIDGFRFDLASILNRDQFGVPTASAPLIEMLSSDPVLASTKLIAEPWDAAGFFQLGSFYPSKIRWGEWNSQYKENVRRFIKGLAGYKERFATSICGSDNLYKNRSPTTSFNYITLHDGFTLADLVSYNQKHNNENGENGRDGSEFNDSWNHGIEGDTSCKKTIKIRERQMKNFHLCLMISQGVPMLLMGDEYGHSKKGNNNTWCHDDQRNWFLWDQLKENKSFYRFYRGLIHFRKEQKLFRREKFLNEQTIVWHGLKPLTPNWSDSVNFIAFTLIDRDQNEDIYVAFNAQNITSIIEIPLERSFKKWHIIVNTANECPDDFNEKNQAVMLETYFVKMLPFSAILLKAK